MTVVAPAAALSRAAVAPALVAGKTAKAKNC
jgi:hypothetical protein